MPPITTTEGFILRVQTRASAILLVAIVLCAGLLPRITAADDNEQIHHLGVLALRGVTEATERWSATTAYLEEALPGHRFVLVPLNLEQIRDAVKEKRISCLLTNPGQFVELESEFDLHALATLNNLRGDKAYTRFGGVIITQSTRQDIQTLSDLKGKSFAAAYKNAFGGFQMAWRELVDAGIDPFSDFSRMEFTGFPQDDVVYAVQNNQVDAGTIRTDILERMASEGKIDRGDFKILNQRTIPGFPFALSTRLYPEWAFSASSTTSKTVREKIRKALLSMPENHPAGRVGKYRGWSKVQDYRSIHELFRTLKVGPYLKRGTTIQWIAWLGFGLAVAALVTMLYLRTGERWTARSIALPFTGAVLLMAAALLIWIAEDQNQEFRDHQAAIAKSSARGVADNISLLIRQHQRATVALTTYVPGLLAGLVKDPNDLAALEQLRKAVRSRMPDRQSFSLATADGELMLSDNISSIGKRCRANIQSFATQKESDFEHVLIHGNPASGHHFDTMARIDGPNGLDSIFFVSFRTDSIVGLLTNAQIPGQSLLIVPRHSPRHIEVSAYGIHHSYHHGDTLSAEALGNTLYETPVAGTAWRLLAIPDPDLFSAYEQRVWTRAGTAFAAMIGIIGLFLWRLRHEERERQLFSHQARHDVLTGLVNRREFELRLDNSVLGARNHQSHHVLGYLDLDNFKNVNDTAGHTAGDEALKKISALLQSKVRTRDTLARLGGDEFGLILEHCGIDQAAEIARNLINAIANFEFEWEGQQYEIGVSIGLVPITTESADTETLLDQADEACYTAKDRGRGQLHIY